MSTPEYYTYAFEKLEVYQLSRKFREDIHRLTKSFPQEEKYSLVSQLRRSAGSTTTNLAEGSGRATNQDRAHFTNLAYSSALETIDHINTAFDLEYISKEVYHDLRLKADEIINKLNAFYKYQLNAKENLKDKLKKNQ